MSPRKDFAGAMNRLTSREVVFGDDKKNQERAGGQPFGESLREQLEKEASASPIREVELARLSDNPFQKLARPSYDEGAMADLVNSIQQNGFYGALLARRRRGLVEQYELAFGHRRKEAARQAGLNSLPVKIIELNDTQMARIMASENFAREDLAPLGEANIIGHLNIEQNLSTTEISKIVGKGEGWIKLRLALFNAPSDIKEMVGTKNETLGHIRLLLQIKDPAARANLIDEILTGSLTREQLQTRLNSNSGDVANQLNRNGSAENPVTNITSSIQYPDSEKSNKSGRTNLAGSNGDKAASDPQKGKITDYRKFYKKEFDNLARLLNELEGQKVAGPVLHEAAPTREEKAVLRALSHRLAELSNDW